jgi:hypothetical protein
MTLFFCRRRRSDPLCLAAGSAGFLEIQLHNPACADSMPETQPAPEALLRNAQARPRASSCRVRDARKNVGWRCPKACAYKFAIAAKKFSEPAFWFISSGSRLGSFAPAVMSCSLRSVKAGTQTTPFLGFNHGGGSSSLVRSTLSVGTSPTRKLGIGLFPL